MDEYDREGPQSCWRKIILLIGRQLASQPKVELTNAVVLGVVGTHKCKYLTNRAEILLDISVLDRLPLRRHNASTNALGENMEERNGVLNVLEVGVDFQPAAEVPPLVPGSGVFIEDSSGENLGGCLLCIIVFSCCLHMDGRGGIRQVLLYEKCVHK